MKKITLSFSIILVVVILLLLIIKTPQFFYDFYSNLFESSSDFNNKVTPIISIIAVIIYALALYNTINQNKILLSQNLKPYFENEIENFIKKSKKELTSKKLLIDRIELPKKITAQNYINVLSRVFIALIKNSEYQSDLKEFNKGVKFNNEYFETRSYFKEIFFLTEFTFQYSPIQSHYGEILEFIREINLSKLIDEDKELLKKRIKRTLIGDYIAFIDFSDRNPSLITPPIPFISMDKLDCKFIKINNTDFRKHYEIFNKVF